MTRKCHNHILQTNAGHLWEEPESTAASLHIHKRDSTNIENKMHCKTKQEPNTKPTDYENNNKQ